MICDACIVCIDGSYITCSSWSYFIVDLNARCVLKSKNGFKHCYTFTNSQIVNFVSVIVLVLEQMFDSQGMRSCQIGDMDVVTNTTSITAWIVIAEHGDLFPHTDGSLRDHRHQVGGILCW